MSIRVALHHKTSYIYDRSVSLSPQIVRLRPAPHCRTPIVSYSLKITPENHFINWQQDPFGNFLARPVFPEKTSEFHVEVDLVADMVIINPFDFFVDPEAENYPFTYQPLLAEDLAPYLKTMPPGEKLQPYLAAIDRGEKQIVDFLVGLNQQLHHEISYKIRMEPNVQSCEETLTSKSGSCRDSAWLLVNILRHLGLAARFVSGYLIQLVADVKPLEGPAGTDKDFTDLHAWTEVYIPGAGWIGLDPTSGLLAGEGHIPLACSPSPQSASPIEGGVDECKADFSFTMQVTRLREAPRSTKPYPKETWSEIEALGHTIDNELQAGDVRLTMGGEPTFVSVDDMGGAEWNTDAVGPTKRILAADLLKRVKGRWAEGGLLHYGQGKWYPGESLPRWAFGCYWRQDGKPLWRNPALIADEAKDYGHGPAEAKRFLDSLCAILGVDTKFIKPAYEDIPYFLWKEGRLPINVDPKDSRLKDPEERMRLRQVFEQGLGAVTGYVLPLCKGSWKSGPWPFKGDLLFLIPGDSPLGLRLPLDSLPPATDEERSQLIERDPMAYRPPLPDQGQMSIPGLPMESIREDVREQKLAPGQPLPVPDEKGAWIVRTALCIQPRQGRLYIFMPPMAAAEDYLELISAIEDAAEKAQLPIIIEGYTPPFDPRINTLKITPDPGVVEVNIHPAANWHDLQRITEELYEEARQTRLGTEKFLLDGRHTGTGGGNHIILGGITPEDSPFLRRPDLLASFIRYLNNHPSLSYLFSGLFIGPTSQQPRMDEARHDSVHEMEIALSELDRQLKLGHCPHWLVDRLFRNLLVDVTGNTHRAEICIDKLFSPDSATGRLGLVEFRFFEMPPHARMSLAQQLLIRSLVAWFWKEPYRTGLVRWGTRLHDRFMLPHFVEEDFTAVLSDLNRAGYPIKKTYFTPHLEFKFPRYGHVSYGSVTLELRQAMEPWHVLGEEPGGGGTVRYVDSSVERCQIKVTGMTEGRHCITCNGRLVPLHPTGTQGEYVAGVRYRAWQPPTCLHPTIPVHVPLVFDLIDTWSGRAIGGCKYHVAHPGGRNYETFPVNANEAEGRRIARFEPFGHTAGVLKAMPQGESNPDFPATLDLRR